MSNPLIDVQAEGQSIWYDNIRRSLISSGGLKQLIEEGIVGVTSNPAIFEKAIDAGSEYDDQIEALHNLHPDEIFEQLAVDDIRNAADVLRPVYERTNKRDGYISMEVSPNLANDTKASIEEAHRLHKEINRPNVFIKIPATPAGMPAIEQLISEGINVNVTLIFAIEAYEQVMEAYIKGLERHQGDLSSIASVASFFVSRVDSNVDKRLDQLEKEKPELKGKIEALKGKAAIANAKLAYQAYLAKFVSGPEAARFKALQARGATLQRPLWASTGTKNPAYSDVMYVDGLIGPDTVNTAPPATIDAFKDHGKVKRTVDTGLDTARQTIKDLDGLGIHMQDVTAQLLDEGVTLFCGCFLHIAGSYRPQTQATKKHGYSRRQSPLRQCSRCWGEPHE